MQRNSESKQRLTGLELNKFRVAHILLLSTPYDGFVLEEDGGLYEQIYHHFSDLSIPFIPQFTRVSGLQQALDELKVHEYSLIITMFRHNDLSSFDVEKQLKCACPCVPIAMLSYERLTDTVVSQIRASSYIDKVFYWSGNSKLLFAIVKHIEDCKNVEEDAKFGVQVILVVEDSPAYYSQIFPLLYTEILSQTRYLVQHAMNASHGLQRVRMRPKILLATNYEQAVEMINKYRKNLLGIISDVRFPKDGQVAADAGLKLARYACELIPCVNFLLQSWETENKERAAAMEVRFLDKNSPNLLHELQEYVIQAYGFGSFVFRYPNGEKIAEAADVTEMEKILHTLPGESLYYHASHNHFSTWFRARTEFEIAEKLLRSSTNGHPETEAIRTRILARINEYFRNYQTGAILDFSTFAKKNLENVFIKIGSGSLGGKARGIAFINSLICDLNIADKYPNVKIRIPRSFVICSDAFNEFIDKNTLYDFITEKPDEQDIARRFLTTALPQETVQNLEQLVEHVHFPLVVRSSSILEDSRILPFAGIYKTYILPNSHPDKAVRLQQLIDAVRLVYASVFYASPMQYAKNAGIRIEEEKMAVLIQELAGEQRGNLFYPVLSGVAQSYNYYPFYPSRPEDGTVSLALGLGKSIVDGERVYRYSPAFPRSNPHFADARDYFTNSQTEFYALNLEKHISFTDNCTSFDEDTNYDRYPLSVAEEGGTLRYIGSTYCAENDCIYDNIARPGAKLVTFAPLLKQNRLPLNNIIKDLLSIGKQSFGSDVEIEFAFDIPQNSEEQAKFYFLQIRPMVGEREAIRINFDENRLQLCQSNHTVGNAVFDNIYDIIFVRPDRFESKNSVQIAQEIGTLNARLIADGRRCILIGFGRLGTSDPWLGIPLSWAQMSQAHVVVEVDTEQLRPDPSLGSHFFHNLTSMNMGYFHIRFHDQQCGMDWDWLMNQPVEQETERVRLIRRTEPFTVMLDGKKFAGRIYL